MLQIQIPAYRASIAMAFTPLWLIAWTFGEFSVGRSVLLGNASLFTCAWLALWTYGGLRAAVALLWQAFGCERVEATASRLSIRREILTFGRTRDFDIGQVKNMRCSPPPQRQSLVHAGAIAFDYGAKTYRFGGGIDEAEANQLLSQIKRALGQSAN